jgi:PAS domain S-box-containing protein
MVQEAKIRESQPGCAPRRESADHGSTDLLVVLDGTGSIREISPSVTRLLAHRRGQLLGTSFLDLLHPDDRAAVLALLPVAAETTEEPVHIQLRVRRADDSWRTFEAVARIVAGSNNQSLVVLDAFDLSGSPLARTAELPAMQLGGSLAQIADGANGCEQEPSDDLPSPDLIERAGARGETVLVALDDPAVSSMACKVMRRLGYTVLEAMSPADAEGFARIHKDKIHLLVADLATPRVRGREFVRSMKKLRPELKSLFVSCQRYGSLAERRVFESGARLLQEPFTPEELAHALRQALEGGSA